jgi:hypothetical protein
MSVQSNPKYHINASCLPKCQNENNENEVDLRFAIANNNSLTLNLDIRPQRQLLGRHARASRLHAAPVLLVGLVHFAKERHVREEDVDFEDGVEAAAGGLQDCGQVLDGAVLFLASKNTVLVLGVCVVMVGLGVLRFALTVRSPTEPSTSLPVAGSTPMAPEQ